MGTTTLQITFNDTDLSILKPLLKRFSLDSKVIRKDENIPNKTTLKAMKEAEEILNDKNRKAFSDVDEFLTFLKNNLWKKKRKKNTN